VIGKMKTGTGGGADESTGGPMTSAAGNCG